jgi:predicted TIM-barrel fold metal-dependent hydrolase
MLADSHIHLFENGYQNSGENTLETYLAIVEKFAISRALVVGYEGEPWAIGNNAYIANLKLTHSWISPLGFLQVSDLSLGKLESLANQGFVGISLYIFSNEDASILQDIGDEIWQWLVDKKWLISINSKGDHWLPWLEVLKRNPTLKLLISHIGLLKIPTKPSSDSEIANNLSTIASLVKFSNVYLKLSGFYALEPSDPVHPYQMLDPYIKYIVERFPKDQLIWGSDFPLSLDKVTFEQTYENLNYIDVGRLSDILETNLVRILK